MKNKYLKNLCALFLAMIFVLSPVLRINIYAADEEAATRGQFAVLVNMMFSLQEEASENFLDVPDGHPYALPLLVAKGSGYMQGDGSGRVYPDDIITGAEAAVIVNNLLSFDASKVSVDSSLKIPEWAKPSASVLLDLGMVSRALIEKSSLTYTDAYAFLNALSTALMYPGSPYQLTQANLKDDFFAYTNRGYLATAKTAPGYIYSMAFTDPAQIVQQQQQEILSSILNAENLKQDSDEWKINELYKMYLDNETRTASISKVMPYFDEINATASISELLNLAKKYINYFNLQPFYAISVNSDAKADATKWAAYLLSGSLDLGSRDYYTDNEMFYPIQQAYREYIADILRYMGETDDLEARAAAIYDIEKTRASLTLPREVLYDPNVLYTEADWDNILEITSTTNTLTYSEEILDYLLDMNIYCPDTNYIVYAESLYANEENLRVLKDYALLNVFSSVSGMLGDDLTELAAKLQKAMYGETFEKLPLEQRSQTFVTNMMSRAFSRMYAERFGSEKVKNDVTDIVENIRDKYRERIMDLTWMSGETKLAAVEKLDAIKAYVAYPNEPVKSVSYEVTAKDAGGSLIDLYFSICEVNYKETLELISKPVNINIWNSVPTSTVNAYYSATENAIIIPAGILQEPFYSPDASREQNLGAIGAVIAHEFTHAFDNNGAQYDKNGTLTNWWTADDYTAFSMLSNSVSQELSAIPFVYDENVNGLLCTGETIADLGAVACILDIAKNMPDADLANVMGSWSSIWAARMSPEVAMYLLYNDTHLPNKLRVNFVLSQMDDFYREYGISQNDGMYIPKEKRINIW